MRQCMRFGPSAMSLRVFLAIGGVYLALEVGAARGGEVLYNGIVLPEVWPPKVQWEDIKARKPLARPPYLVQPPAVIPIDVGRQLFVDDFLIEQTTLRRTYHLAKYHPANPVFTGGMPFSGGVFWISPDDSGASHGYVAAGGPGFTSNVDTVGNRTTNR